MGAVVKVSELSDINRLEQRPLASVLAQCRTLGCSPSRNAAHTLWSQKLPRGGASLSATVPSFLAPGQCRSVSQSVYSGRAGMRQQPGWGSALPWQVRVQRCPVANPSSLALTPRADGAGPGGLPMIRKAQPHLWTKHLMKS